MEKTLGLLDIFFVQFLVNITSFQVLIVSFRLGYSEINTFILPYNLECILAKHTSKIAQTNLNQLLTYVQCYLRLYYNIIIMCFI